ncbi:MAG: carbohydrate kinase [Oscillospiraceae bacterium]|nr:carbohydrate kinase [Oscillospiraceae bacterium]
MEHYLLIDLGTGSTRAALVSSAGEIVGIRSFMNRYYRDGAYPDAQFFIPEEWEAELKRCCLALHAEHPDIRVRCVSAAGARQSIVLLDGDGKAFYGLPNIDNRGREFMGEIGNTEHIYERSGKWVTEDFCAAKLLGLRKRRPELYGRIRTVLSLSGYIAWIFTGKAVFEPSQACETQLYDLETKDWSDELCMAYGIDRGLLPSLSMAGESVGAISPDLREDLEMEEDACFIIGGADTQCGLLQTGIQPGEIAVVSGTTTPITALVDHKFYDPRQRVWTDANLGADGYLIEMNPGVTGLNYQRIKDVLCPDLSYEELERAYAAKRDFTATASFSSLLFYEKRSLRQGGFFLRSPWPDDMDRIDLMWAALADTACATYEQLWRLCELCGYQKGYVLACGGGFRSGTLCQMLADLSGLELRLRPGFEQATLLGLTVLCSRALGQPELHGEAGAVRRYKPRRNDLIRRYHKRWSENRMALNPPAGIQKNE